VLAGRRRAGPLARVVGDNEIGWPEPLNRTPANSLGWQLAPSFVAQLRGREARPCPPGAVFTLLLPGWKNNA